MIDDSDLENMIALLKLTLDEVARLEDRLEEVCPDHEACVYCKKASCLSCEVGPRLVACEGAELHCDECMDQCVHCLEEIARDDVWQRELDLRRGK